MGCHLPPGAWSLGPAALLRGFGAIQAKKGGRMWETIFSPGSTSTVAGVRLPSKRGFTFDQIIPLHFSTINKIPHTYRWCGVLCLPWHFFGAEDG